MYSSSLSTSVDDVLWSALLCFFCFVVSVSVVTVHACVVCLEIVCNSVSVYVVCMCSSSAIVCNCNSVCLYMLLNDDSERAITKKSLNEQK